MTVVVRLFETLPRAHGAVEDLVGSGFPHGSVSVLLTGELAEDDLPPVFAGGVIVSASGRRRALIAAGPLAATLRDRRVPDAGRVPDVLCAAGLSRFAATYFNEAICDGGVLVAVHCDENHVRDARDILDTHAPDGFDEGSIPAGERSIAGGPPARVNGKEHLA